MATFPGFCSISQNESYLTEFNEKAVTGLGARTKWLVTFYPDEATPGTEEIPMTLLLLPAGGGESRTLTLGEKVEGEQGIQIGFSTPVNPPTRNQLWTMQGMIATKRFPPLLHTHITPVECPELAAAAGILNIPLPRIFMNVAAVDKGQLLENRMWKFDYYLEE